jgi:hypothetical protein
MVSSMAAGPVGVPWPASTSSMSGFSRLIFRMAAIQPSNVGSASAATRFWPME